MKKKVSLKWKIARYLLFFAAAMIGVVLLFQIGLLQPMYQGFSGRAIMTGYLGLYAAAVLLAERILRSGQDGEER